MSKPPTPSYAALRAFAAVGLAGGIRRAALVMGIDHAIVSRHISSLERHFNIALYDRNENELTEAGRLYHERVHSAILALEDASAVLQADDQQSLKISCSAGFALHWLMKRLADFSRIRRWPLIDLAISGTGSEVMQQDMDADIRYILDCTPPPIDHNVRFLDLARPTVFPVATPQFLARLAEPVTSAADLGKLPLIEEINGTEWNAWFTAQGVAIPQQRYCIGRYSQSQLTIAAAKSGRGIALGNRFLVSEELEAGQLQIVGTVNGPLLPARIGVYRFQCKRAYWDNPGLLRFRNWLMRAIEEDSRGD